MEQGQYLCSAEALTQLVESSGARIVFRADRYVGPGIVTRPKVARFTLRRGLRRVGRNLLSSTAAASDPRRPPHDPGTFLLDAYTVFFGTVTIFYEAILFLKAPSWWLAVTIGLSAALAIFIAVRPRDLSPSGSAIADVPTLLFVLAGALGFSLFVAAVNPDDYLFFHRALLQLGHLGAPISRTTDFLDVATPALSNAHLLSAFEPVFTL